MGLVNQFSEYENSILGYHREPKYSKGMFLDRDAIRKEAKERIEKYDIRPPTTEMTAAKFSGGNQQKIVLAREIECDPDVLLIGQQPAALILVRLSTSTTGSWICGRREKQCFSYPWN